MQQVDPYLHLVEDCRLQAVHMAYDSEKTAYGSQKDEAAGLESLSTIVTYDSQLKDTVVTHLLKKYRKLSEVSSNKNHRNHFVSSIWC